MHTQRTITALIAVLLSTVLTFAADAQSASAEKAAAQSQLVVAESAIASAQAAGAATRATELYEEAARRLQVARANWSSNDGEQRRIAALRAIEAGHAAAAAEALALLVAANEEIRTLSTDVRTFGATAPTIDAYAVPVIGNRGTTSLDRVIVAETALNVARSVGGERVAPADIKRAEEILQTARRLARNQQNAPSADHLAFVAEMMARRAEYIARREVIAPQLTTLRADRTRLAQEASARRAAEEQERRLQAERQAAELRRQLDVEAASRQIEQAELERLRQQLAASEAELRAQLEEDREARVLAERALDDLIATYQSALAAGQTDSSEVEALRRQIEDQQLALRTIHERERINESAMANQVNSLESALARERSEGRLTAEALAQRESELQRQREELARLRSEREASEQRRIELENTRAAAIAEADRRRAAAEAQADSLRQQIAAERARAAETEAELARAREELARRDTENRQRLSAMQTELAKLAETRTTERGFIVTLPGLFFDSGRHALKAGARNTLSKIADQLKINDSLTIAIEGHTDSVGGDEMNQALSERRANAVRDYLVSRGIPTQRMTTRGLGETAPVATNDTPAGRQQNRRVELIIAQ